MTVADGNDDTKVSPVTEWQGDVRGRTTTGPDRSMMTMMREPETATMKVTWMRAIGTMAEAMDRHDSSDDDGDRNGDGDGKAWWQ